MLCGNPDGWVGWGLWEECPRGRGYIYTCIEPTRFIVQQKPTKNYKATIPQNKNTQKSKKRKHLEQSMLRPSWLSLVVNAWKKVAFYVITNPSVCSFPILPSK